MNNETEDMRENDGGAAEAAALMVSELQDEVDSLTVQLDTAKARVTELETHPAEASAPVGDEELRALAATVRNAQRNGHPDAATHLNTLLNTLGAL